MLKQTKLKLTLAISGALLAFDVSAAVITFNSNADQSYFVPSVSSDGFTLTANENSDLNIGTSDNFDGENFNNNGSVYFTTWSNSLAYSMFTLMKTDQSFFSLNSFEFKNAYANGSSLANSITLDGLKADNSHVFQTFADLSSISSFTNLTVNTAFQNLASVKFIAAGMQNTRALYDNITVDSANAVPEPTSIALLGMGLLGFAASRRKKSA